MIAADYRNTICVGDCREHMRAMAGAGVRVQCVVTSPPYWGLRDYSVPGQYGLERTWQRYVARLRSVFRCVWDILEDDGVVWLNLGDSYAGDGGQSPQTGQLFKGRARQRENICLSLRGQGDGLKPKDLVLMPARVALALQADGWYVRSDVIWHKPNPMPESVTDRPTKAHEYLFLLAKSETYQYNHEAIKEPSVTDDPHRPYGSAGANELDPRESPQGAGKPRAPANVKRGGFGGKTADLPGREAFRAFTEQRNARSVWSADEEASFTDWFFDQPGSAEWFLRYQAACKAAASERDVWRIVTSNFPGAHFATFPRELVRRCIMAGSNPGQLVFDPFMGSGTVAEVAQEHGRDFLGCELNAEYAGMFDAHRSRQKGLGLL